MEVKICSQPGAVEAQSEKRAKKQYITVFWEIGENTYEEKKTVFTQGFCNNIDTSNYAVLGRGNTRICRKHNHARADYLLHIEWQSQYLYKQLPVKI